MAAVEPPHRVASGSRSRGFNEDPFFVHFLEPVEGEYVFAGFPAVLRGMRFSVTDDERRALACRRVAEKAVGEGYRATQREDKGVDHSPVVADPPYRRSWTGSACVQ